MLSLISLVCAVLGYILFFLTEMAIFPFILIIAGLVLSLVDLVMLYSKEKLQFDDFIKEAFQTNWGSIISFIGGVAFLILLFIYG